MTEEELHEHKMRETELYYEAEMAKENSRFWRMMFLIAFVLFVSTATVCGMMFHKFVLNG